jgi:hypothetical protein
MHQLESQLEVLVAVEITTQAHWEALVQPQVVQEFHRL